LVIYQLGIFPDFRLLLRIFLAAILMGAVLFLLRDSLNLFANIGLGSLIYIFSILILRAIPPDLSIYLTRVHSRLFKNAD
jgi:hypothetical protein